MASSSASINDNASSIISQPPPTFIVNNYPTAPTILPSSTILTPSLQLTLRDNITVELSSTITVQCTTISNHNDVLYYYQEPPSYKNDQENQQDLKDLLLLLYDIHKNPIWKLKSRDWHGMTLIHEGLEVILSTTPPQFRFAINEQKYHWQVQLQNSSYTLKCFQTESKLFVAELKENQLCLYNQNSEYNPFRQLTQIDPHITLIILSGLLVNHHLKNLLKSLGGGPEALQMMADPNEVCINSNTSKSTPGFHPERENGEDEDEDDDIASLSYTRNYPGHQSLVYDRDLNNRWSSSAQSFKSIELDPGVWHCWWGYKFWWSWFPCCMPGGYCDRACIRLKGHRPKVRSTRTLSKQGWQQQHY
ncbi:hypothetical protein HMPREF1544_08995 [Mucor circinelloides 1006PhL]|uniref:Uncharacterized protein n=1 Tax=Mucor circinelloides f. circinelloides (strain 1006PhL) TaxID=1220926 RepID=S2JWR3_MUCC1|nr:hypothetical protein HMPREF1544_08995 [Mucor circinelloides 1006PhL]